MGCHCIVENQIGIGQTGTFSFLAVFKSQEFRTSWIPPLQHEQGINVFVPNDSPCETFAKIQFCLVLDLFIFPRISLFRTQTGSSSKISSCQAGPYRNHYRHGQEVMNFTLMLWSGLRWGLKRCCGNVHFINKNIMCLCVKYKCIHISVLILYSFPGDHKQNSIVNILWLFKNVVWCFWQFANSWTIKPEALSGTKIQYHMTLGFSTCFVLPVVIIDYWS